jgi:hypothetical protein
MKINIGPYRNRWTTLRFEEWYIRIKYGNKQVPYWNGVDLVGIQDVGDLEDGDWLDRSVQKISDIWQDLLNLTVNKIIDGMDRKVKVRIDPYDTWSMDNTLALIILPMLKQLRKSTHSSCQVDDADVPEELRSTAVPVVVDHNIDDNYHKRWEWVLGEMIWAFEQIVDEDHESQFFDHSVKPYVHDREGHVKHSERIQRGTILFGKYYQGLWD